MDSKNDDFVFPACENIEKKSDKKTWFWTECLEDAKNSGCKMGTAEFWLVYKIRVYETHGDYKFCVAGVDRLASDIGVTVEQVKVALMNACLTGKLFHIWSDKKVYRNKTKIYVTKQWLEEKGLNPENLVIKEKGKRNTHFVSGSVLENGEISEVRMQETKCQNVETKCENVETKCENVVSPRMNKYKRISENELSKKERSYDEILDENEVHGKLRDAFLEFIKSRKLNGTKLTNHALELAIKKVRGLESDESRQIEVLEQSILSGWSGIFPLREEKNSSQRNATTVKSYQPKDGEDITYQRVFEKWKQYLGASVLQTEEQVEACKNLLDDVGEEWVEKMIVGLRMRSQTNFVVREIKAIQDFVGLANNRSLMMAFCDEHWKEWELKVREAKTGKKPWEV